MILAFRDLPKHNHQSTNVRSSPLLSLPPTSARLPSHTNRPTFCPISLSSTSVRPMHGNAEKALCAARVITCFSARRRQLPCAVFAPTALPPNERPTPAKRALVGTLRSPGPSTACRVLLANMERETVVWWRKQLAGTARDARKSGNEKVCLWVGSAY